jgi:hypothetical protein
MHSRASPMPVMLLAAPKPAEFIGVLIPRYSGDCECRCA